MYFIVLPESRGCLKRQPNKAFLLVMQLFYTLLSNISGSENVLDGLLSSILSREKKRPLGVCIPDSTKTKIEAEQLQREKEEAERKTHEFFGTGFAVSGIFHFHDSLMVQGTAFGVKIRKNDKILLQGIRLIVKDVQVENKSAGSINPGQKGALFIKAEKGHFPIIRIGDVLEIVFCKKLLEKVSSKSLLPAGKSLGKNSGFAQSLSPKEKNPGKNSGFAKKRQ